MPAVLEVTHLHHAYGSKKAVNDVSFRVQQGKCLGLLGPNGAGKTTTVEMLEGIIQPDAGEIRYLGHALDNTFRHCAGIMFQSTSLPEFISVRETLKLFQGLYDKTRTIEELVSLCALDDFVDQDAHRLSGGQKQRLLLALALVNDPDILFLDEPTTGLDPQARRHFWDLINKIKQENKTILLTTHYMEEAYRLSDEVIIMDHGHIIAEGTPDSLLAAHFNDVVLQLPIDCQIQLTADAPFEIIQDTELLELKTSRVEQSLQFLMKQNISMEKIRIRDRTLEDLFLELTGSAIR